LWSYRGVKIVECLLLENVTSEEEEAGESYDDGG
jgi:hypothetical protein